MSVRQLRALLVFVVVIDVAYWALWFGARSWVASEDRAAYVEFENAFPAADAWLGVLCVLAWFALGRRRPSAVLWLIAAGGAGMYLLCMDVLYDLQHGIYLLGAGGLIEAVINVLTAVLSISVLRWTWWHRDELLAA